MPSPFPGMDPYLEDPVIWPDFHHELISEIRAVLNRGIRPNYRASVEERVYVSREDDPGRRAIIPDVAGKGPADDRVADGAAARSSTDGQGDLAVAEPITATTMIDEEIHEARIAIVDVHGGKYLVHVSRRGSRPNGTLWPIRLTQKLPTIPIPLLPQDDDFTLDLQAVFDSAYDRAGYDLAIDYRRKPTIALDDSNASWVRQWLDKKGLEAKG